MRLTDFCLIFAGLFVCMFLGRDLYLEGQIVQRTTQVAYDRQMDRIAEDALMDIVETELEDGTPVVRVEQMREQYAKLLSLSFGLSDDDCRLRAWEAVTLWQFSQYPYAISAQQLDEIRSGMEAQINDVKRRRRELSQLAVALPYLSYEDWYQTLAGPQLVTMFDPRDPLWGIDRAFVSGSRIVKRSSM